MYIGKRHEVLALEMKSNFQRICVTIFEFKMQKVIAISTFVHSGLTQWAIQQY